MARKFQRVSSFCSMMRLRHNLGVYDSWRTAGRMHEFHLFFSNWKMLNQMSRKRYGSFRVKKQTTKLFLSIVYRTGERSLFDHGDIPKRVLSHMTPKEAESSTKMLQKDYLGCVLEKGSVYTAPQTEAELEIPPEASLEVACDMIDDAANSCFSAFRILDLHPRRKKLFGDTEFIFRECVFPILSQPLHPIPDAVAYPQPAYTMCARDDAAITDVGSLAPWRNLRTGLRSWQVLPFLFFLPLPKVRQLRPSWAQGPQPHTTPPAAAHPNGQPPVCHSFHHLSGTLLIPKSPPPYRVWGLSPPRWWAPPYPPQVFPPPIPSLMHVALPSPLSPHPHNSPK